MEGGRWSNNLPDQDKIHFIAVQGLVMTAIPLLILAQKEMYVAVCIEATEKLGKICL